MKHYVGRRDESGCHVTAVEGNKGRCLSPRLDLENHSPTGFEWGYGGSGPAQLALAILADALGDDKRAVRLHQRFKFQVISRLPDHWWLTQSRVLNIVRELEQERAA